MQEDSQLRADLTAANNIIASLWEEQLDTRDWLLAMEGMFDFIPSENPKTMWAWETRRQALQEIMHLATKNVVAIDPFSWLFNA